ncbi:phosphatidylinositol-specific phospholipase C1-like protein [Aporhodopirellula aestuarii]|uniref:Phosphatidylinositol-specific phospholipase C1-like protein n=1 Tax=Aporhodopirellula aestuarii TaxID=2950107 RepID=A0ABT0UAK7_9BACT|nr:phosphatidylinositol-specific phospholipase C1-like protein [Aporhodopirellula aestuarii]MCM2373361.1 phosphatidylinositol-specific phospholipase C1-like protein [Aporhodopirellula aestuarii]
MRSQYPARNRNGVRDLVMVFICGVAQVIAGYANAQELRLNEIQTVGTHNSYRISPPREILGLIKITSPASAEALDYSHRPIAEQLGDLKMRQLELDIYADPKGGLYSNPIGHASLPDNDESARLHPNAEGAMDLPGMKVLHSPGFDYRSTVPTFVAALKQIHNWSQRHPTHVPILVLVELKDSVVGPALVKPVPYDEKLLDDVDVEIRSVFEDGDLILPDQIRGTHQTLRDAVIDEGWPRLDECRGRVWFALDNEGQLRERYLAGHPSLRGRVMFVSVDPNHEAAAFRKLNDPIRNFAEIRDAVRRGLIVRTRADVETRQARSGDTRRRERAFESGAQYISTDYPVADPRLTDYRVALPGEVEYRVNPVTSRRD